MRLGFRASLRAATFGVYGGSSPDARGFRATGFRISATAVVTTAHIGTEVGKAYLQKDASVYLWQPNMSASAEARVTCVDTLVDLALLNSGDLANRYGDWLSCLGEVGTLDTGGWTPGIELAVCGFDTPIQPRTERYIERPETDKRGRYVILGSWHMADGMSGSPVCGDAGGHLCLLGVYCGSIEDNATREVQAEVIIPGTVVGTFLSKCGSPLDWSTQPQVIPPMSAEEWNKELAKILKEIEKALKEMIW